MKTKTCPRCKKRKRRTEFWPSNFQSDGLASYCRKCQNERGKLLMRRKYKKNPTLANEKIRQCKQRVKKLVLNAYGKVCQCCGENHIEFLCIDHINGGGNQERRELNRRSGYAFYAYLKKMKFPKGYQVLCHNCNMAKSLFGKCPHKNEK